MKTREMGRIFPDIVRTHFMNGPLGLLPQSQTKNQNAKFNTIMLNGKR